jgi:hypothetical protein
MGRPQLALHATQRVGLQRVRVHLHLVDAAAPFAADCPVFKANAGLGNELNVHVGLAHPQDRCVVRVRGDVGIWGRPPYDNVLAAGRGPHQGGLPNERGRQLRRPCFFALTTCR